MKTEMADAYLNGVDDIDSGAVGGEDTRRHSQTFESLLDSDFLLRMDYLSEQLKLCLKSLPHKEAFVCQEHGYFDQGCGHDRHIHPPGADQWEHDPTWDLDHRSTRQVETVNIADRKLLVPSRHVRSQVWTRSVNPEQDQGGVPSEFDRSHAIVPSGSYHWFDYFTFMSVLTSLYYSSQCRPVFTEMNNSLTGDAYCFGNVFVSMSALSGYSAVPILHDSARMITESFENALVPRDNEDGLDGTDNDYDTSDDDDNIDGVTIPCQM